MATTKFSQTATAKVPYHFVCNYCGKRNDKITYVSATGEKTIRGAYHGRAEGTPWAAEAGSAAEWNLREEIKRIDNNIKDYGEGLREGRTFRYSFFAPYYLKGEHPDHLTWLNDAKCVHCGKQQVWWASPAGKARLTGCLIPLLGLLLTFLMLFLIPFEISSVLGVVFFLGVYVLSWVISRRHLKKNISKIAAEPNDPDKLPVLDIDLGFGAQPQKQKKEVPAVNKPVKAETAAFTPSKTQSTVLEKSVNELLGLYESVSGGYHKSQKGSRAVKKIGEDLNKAGGTELMLKAQEMFVARNPLMARNLEIMWEGIGKQEEKKAPVDKPVSDTGSLLEDSVNKLLTLYQGAPEGFLKSQAGAVRKIGKDLNNAGEMELMLKAHEMFAARNPQMARNLEIVWDGIGDWRG